LLRHGRVRVFTPVMSTRLSKAQELLHTDDKGSGYFPPVSPESVALAQVHALLAIAQELARAAGRWSRARPGSRRGAQAPTSPGRRRFGWSRSAGRRMISSQPGARARAMTVAAGTIGA
jgi:hypothetical protein